MVCVTKNSGIPRIAIVTYVFVDIVYSGAVSIIFGGAANEAYPAHTGLLGTVAFKNRGIIIYGSRASEGFGFSVEVADVNGDGVMDVIGTSIAARSSTGNT